MAKKKSQAAATATKTTKKPIPPNTPAAIRHIAGQLPPGITLKHPLPGFPPELDVAIREAKKSGVYQVAIWRADENGVIHCHRTNSDGWQYGWHLVALKLLEQQILRLTPPGLGAAGAVGAGAGPAG